MNNQLFDAILDSYRAGVEDGFLKGVYRNPHDDRGLVYSAYKRGYDAGIALFCQTEGLEEE
jgi:hypothetical protein